MRAIEEQLGPVEVLVLNATGPQPDALVEDTAWEDHQDQLDFFVRSPVLLGRAVLPGMRALGSGRIVHVDSEVADRPPVGRSAYAAAKAAQIALARAWAHELAPDGITVNAVAPGFVPVERHAAVGGEVRAGYVASVPAGRFGTPEEVAHASRSSPRPVRGSSPGSGWSSTAGAASTCDGPGRDGARPRRPLDF